MWDLDCGCVPVVDATGKVLAMLTDRDVCMAAFTRGLRLWEMTVASAASRHVIAVRPDDTLETAAQRMREHQIRRLPVVDGEGKLVGVLSTNDLVRRARMGHHHSDVSADSVLKTLSGICRPANPSTAAAAAAAAE
jgi:CBS-domain-containing membrane protein